MDNILILALILIIIMFFLCKNIFDKCNRDSLGNELNFYNTCQNIFGLYDDNQNLLAVGKLSQPLPISRTTDTSIFINIDR